MGIDSDAFEEVLRELAQVDPIVVFGYIEKHDGRFYNAAAAEITGDRDDCIACGPTAIINPYGVVVAQVPLMQAGMVVAGVG